MEAAIGQFLQAQQGRIIDRIRPKVPKARKATTTADILARLDAKYWGVEERELLAIIMPLLREGAERGVDIHADGVDVDLGLGVDWTLPQSDAAKWARKYGADLVKGVTKTTKRAIGDHVSTWYETPGVTLPDLEKQLRDTFAFSRKRARLIAITETTRAYKEGELIAGDAIEAESLFKYEKVWQTVNDDRVCLICEPLNQTSVKGVRGLFKTEVGELDGPPAHPGCRCGLSLVPVVGEEEAEAEVPTIEQYGEQWRGNLSDEQAKAMDDYQGTKFRVDNLVLRRGEVLEFEPPFGWSERDAARIDRITEALAKATTQEDYTVYRGFMGSNTSNRMGQLRPGDVFSDGAFVSTSTNQEYALKEFRGRGDVALAQINVPKGSRAAYLTTAGETAPEWELLIQRGARFEVEGFTELGEHRVINLRLMDTTPGRFWRNYDDWEDLAFD